MPASVLHVVLIYSCVGNECGPILGCDCAQTGEPTGLQRVFQSHAASRHRVDRSKNLRSKKTVNARAHGSHDRERTGRCPCASASGVVRELKSANYDWETNDWPGGLVSS